MKLRVIGAKKIDGYKDIEAMRNHEISIPIQMQYKVQLGGLEPVTLVFTIEELKGLTKSEIMAKIRKLMNLDGVEDSFDMVGEETEI